MKKILMSVFAAISLCSFSVPGQEQDAELFKSENKNMNRFANVLPSKVKTISCIALGSYPGSEELPDNIDRAKLKKRPGNIGKVIFIERAAKVRNNLETLFNAKFFDGAASAVFCKTAVEVQNISREFAAKLDIQSVNNFPYGHAACNYCIDYQRTASVKDGSSAFPALKNEIIKS